MNLLPCPLCGNDEIDLDAVIHEGEYKHVAPDGHPKPTSECLYHIPTINRWIKNLPDPDFDL